MNKKIQNKKISLNYFWFKYSSALVLLIPPSFIFTLAWHNLIFRAMVNKNLNIYLSTALYLAVLTAFGILLGLLSARLINWLLPDNRIIPKQFRNFFNWHIENLPTNIHYSCNPPIPHGVQITTCYLVCKEFLQLECDEQDKLFSAGTYSSPDLNVYLERGLNSGGVLAGVVCPGDSICGKRVE